MLDSFKNMVLLMILMILLVQGHRVVHGGELFPKSALVTDEVEEKLSH